jgi:group II intron reverse transcriptase/maturase
MQLADGSVVQREKGTPQGGVISPILANLFLHYAFDKWLQKYHPNKPWCRYADDGLVHCRSEAQAYYMLQVLRQRFEECGLELHPEKTKIVYCKDERRTGDYHHTAFDFLGYTFRRRGCKDSKAGLIFLGFAPAVSKHALKEMRRKIRKTRIRSRTDWSLNEIAGFINPVVRGWLSYYGAFYRSEMYRLIRHVNKTLVRWAMRKYKSLRFSKHRAVALLERIAQQKPDLFVHWQKGMKGAFA